MACLTRELSDPSELGLKTERSDNQQERESQLWHEEAIEERWTHTMESS